MDYINKIDDHAVHTQMNSDNRIFLSKINEMVRTVNSLIKIVDPPKSFIAQFKENQPITDKMYDIVATLKEQKIIVYCKHEKEMHRESLQYAGPIAICPCCETWHGTVLPNPYVVWNEAKKSYEESCELCR